VVATIVPFDVERILRGTQDLIHPKHDQLKKENEFTPERLKSNFVPVEKNLADNKNIEGLQPIGKISWRNRAHVQGRVTSIKTAPNNSIPSVDVEIWDESGGVTLQFLGRREISGLDVGSILNAEGMVGENQGNLVILNPSYKIIN
jgi:hypothetical protein